MTVASNAIRSASRAMVPNRAMSNAAAPRLHKAKDAWKELKSTRPPEGHPHVSKPTVELPTSLSVEHFRYNRRLLLVL